MPASKTPPVLSVDYIALADQDPQRPRWQVAKDAPRTHGRVWSAAPGGCKWVMPTGSQTPVRVHKSQEVWWEMPPL